jgi:hypothetical protein
LPAPIDFTLKRLNRFEKTFLFKVKNENTSCCATFFDYFNQANFKGGYFILLLDLLNGSSRACARAVPLEINAY